MLISEYEFISLFNNSKEIFLISISWNSFINTKQRDLTKIEDLSTHFLKVAMQVQVVDLPVLI